MDSVVDPYTITAAYISEYAAGYGVGYQLAEYTPGQAAVVVAPQPTGNANATAIIYPNGNLDRTGERTDRRERRERERGLESMNALGMTLPDISATPTIRSSQLSQEANSQAAGYDMGSVTTGDSASLILSTPSRRAPRDAMSMSSLTSSAQSQKTQSTGLLTDNATLSSFNTGMSSDSMLTRDRSLRQQPTSRGGDASSVSSLGLRLPAILNDPSNPNGTSRSSPRPRYLRHASVPTQAFSTGAVTTTTTTVANMTTTTTTASAAQPSTAPVPDNRSVRTSLTQDSASTWGTIYTHSAPLLDWQSTGSSLNLGLRTFGANVGQGSGEVDENWGPVIPPSMVLNDTTNGGATSGSVRNGNDHVRNNSGGFPVVRESDEERTPMSRSTRTLASVSSAGATNGSGARPVMDVMDAQAPQTSSGHRERNREQERSERQRDRNRDRTRSRDRRRQSHPASLLPASVGEGTRHAQMMNVSEHTTGQSRTQQQHATYTSAQQMSQLWFEGSAAGASAGYVQPHTLQSSSHPQPQSQTLSQSQNRRPHRRLSVSTAPVDSQHTGVVPNTAPAHNTTAWSDAGYYTDVPTSTQVPHHNTHNTHGTPNSNALTSPTLFNSNATTNALGLDGLNEPRPLQITAPTPIVSSRSFLRSFSYDQFM